ncbi:MAG: ComF family protein, partial [Pseudomonas formosensis]|nr:ComF family protein [Halopseudomonas formosensis]
MKTLVYKWININQINRCLLCLGSAAGAPDCICPPCLDDLPWLGPACRQCALPLSAEGLLCGKCQQRPPAFSQVIAPLRYRFPIDSLIPAFK